MPALLKFLVPLAIFLSASNANACTSLSSVAGNQVRVNHVTQLQQPMSDPTNEPSRKPTCEPTNDQTTKQRLEWDAELPNILSQKRGKYSLSQKQDAELPNKITISITQGTSDTSYKFEAVYNVDSPHDATRVTKRVTFSDKRDNEIHSDSRPNEWRMPDKINLDFSGLRRSACSAVLSRREKVYSHSTTVLKSVKRSSKHACLVLFSSFCAIGAALNGGVHSHQVLATSSSQRVRGIASTQTRGLCHDKKSERAGCIASAQMSSKELLEANANLQITNDFRRGSLSHFNVGRFQVYCCITF